MGETNESTGEAHSRSPVDVENALPDGEGEARDVRPERTWERTSLWTMLRRGLTFDDVVVAAIALFGFAWALQSISDNTMLLHLRTGIDMVRTGSIPTHDPYSFTAEGERWVVQSWLIEGLYGVLDRMAGLHLVIIVNALALMMIAGGSVALARTGNLARTTLIALIIAGIGMGQWSTRPTTFAFLFFFTAVWLIERRRSHWWFLLLGALWVNSHGSWPLAMIWLAISGFGAAVDADERRLARFRALGMFAVGVVIAGVINPVGWRLLLFPLVPLGDRGEIFPSIVEWASPNFHNLGSFSGAPVLVGLLLAIIVLARTRPRWTDLLPCIAFLALALYSQRNFAFLAIVLAPALGRALLFRPKDAFGIGRPFVMPRRWGVLEVASVLALLFVGVGQTINVTSNEPIDHTEYPVAALEYLDAAGLGGKNGRVVAPDFVGCYRIFIDGTEANVFIDDRYDMYPADFVKDAFVVFRASGDVQQVLKDHQIDAVLWQRSKPLPTYLYVDSQWRHVYIDKDWIVFRRA